MAGRMLSVIATSGERLDLLLRTLSSLCACRRPEGYEGVLVAENNTQPRVLPLIEQADWNGLEVRYLHVARKNKSAALNAALRSAGDVLIYFHDDDLRLSADCLEAVKEAAGIVRPPFFLGGPVAADRDREPPPWLLSYLPHSARGWQLSCGTVTLQEGPVFLGGNFAARSSDLLDAGGFDESLGPDYAIRGEDTRIQEELLKRGFQGYYVPDALVWHCVPAERCSPDWALRRALCSSAYYGMSQPLAGRMRSVCSLLYRIPYAVVKHLAASRSASEEVRFASRYQLVTCCGRLFGALLGRSAVRSLEARPVSAVVRLLLTQPRAGGFFAASSSPAKQREGRI